MSIERLYNIHFMSPHAVVYVNRALPSLKCNNLVFSKTRLVVHVSLSLSVSLKKNREKNAKYVFN